MAKKVRTFKLSETGQGCVEYTLILVIVVIVAVAVLAIFGVLSAIHPAVAWLFSIGMIVVFVVMRAQSQSVADFLNDLFSPEDDGQSEDLERQPVEQREGSGKIEIHIDTDMVKVVGMILAIIQTIVSIIALFI